MTNGQPPQSIIHKTTRGISWNFLAFALQRFISFVIVSILAHLLSPDDFGVVALATIAVNFLSILNDLGLSKALIQRRDEIEGAANTVFVFNIIIGTLLTIISFLIAPLVADYFEEPIVTPMLRWLGTTFLINSFGSAHLSFLQRDLDFRKIMIPDLGNVFTRGITSIGLAMAGLGAWSLVFGQLSGAIISVILVWRVLPWRPRLIVNQKIAKELFKFGISIIGIDLLGILEMNLDYLIIGRVFGTVTLGIYTLAYRLPETLVIHILWVLATVLFPAFSTIQDQKDTLRQSFLLATRYLMIIITPICLGLIIVADPIIRIAFGDSWLDAIPIMQILAAYALIHSVGFHIGDIFKAIGRPDIVVKLSVPTTIIKVLALIIGAQFSIIGVAIGRLISGFFEVALRFIAAKIVANITPKQILLQLSSFFGGIGLISLALPTLLLTSNTPIIIQLLAVILAGAVGYLSVMWYLERDNLIELKNMIGPLFQKR